MEMSHWWQVLLILGGLLPTFITEAVLNRRQRLVKMKVHLPPSKILDFRLRISEALAILRLAQGLAALALPIQANEEGIGLPFPQLKQLKAPMIFNIL